MVGLRAPKKALLQMHRYVDRQPQMVPIEPTVRPPILQEIATQMVQVAQSKQSVSSQQGEHQMDSTVAFNHSLEYKINSISQC